MTSQFYIQYENVNLHKMTRFQRLLFTYLLGNLSLEDQTMFGKNAGIKVEKTGMVHITFNEINPKLIEEYFKKFAFADLTNGAYQLMDNRLYIDHTEIIC